MTCRACNDPGDIAAFMTPTAFFGAEPSSGFLQRQHHLGARTRYFPDLEADRSRGFRRGLIVVAREETAALERLQIIEACIAVSAMYFQISNMSFLVLNMKTYVL